jgi:hypothetical protein
MPDLFDPYREALVIETNTIWPEEIGKLVTDMSERQRLDERLHAEPSKAAQLDYVRLFTGFCRQITVTPADLDRLRSK